MAPNCRKFFLMQNDMVDLATMQYVGFGKKFIRKHKLHPDTFVHMALQHAYHKMHHR